MQESKIILTPISQANGAIKNLPALVLRKMPKYQDLLVCGVSTQLKQYIPNFSLWFQWCCYSDRPVSKLAQHPTDD